MHDSYVSYMNVKTADLKNNLSRYLRRIRETGETLIVCDREEPVATLSPIQRDEDAEWQRHREECLARARRIGLKMEMPLRRPDRSKKPVLEPRVAPDGRTDLRTIDFVRGGRDY